MAKSQVTTRQAFRRTDDYTPGKPRVKLVTEPLPLPLHPTSVLIKVHAVALNYRDANIANGGNPWPVTPFGMPCNDAAGEIIAVRENIKDLKVGDKVAPTVDTENLTGREPRRSWLAADEDGVLADYLVYDERIVCKLPEHLNWVEASVIPCAGVTAWTAMKDIRAGQTMLVQCLKVILTSSSDKKLNQIKECFPTLPLLTVNYATNPTWEEEVLQLTGGVGVDLVIEVGGTGSLVQSMKCTRRGGTVSQVGYLSKQNPMELAELIPLIIDRRILLRGINAGSKQDLDDLCAAISAVNMRFDDIIDSVMPFEKADEAIEMIWQGKQVGKIVLEL